MEILGQCATLEFVLVTVLLFTGNGDVVVSSELANIETMLNRSEVKQPGPIARRMSSADLFKNFQKNGSISPDSEQTPQVEILEAGASLREERGEKRILKRGPPPPHPPPRTRTRVNSDSLFNLRNSLKKKPKPGPAPPTRNGYRVPIIAIPGGSIPPPVYSYTGAGGPRPPPSMVADDSYRPTTSQPEIIIPPETNPPRPIRPAPVTSVPIIGGGGGSGSILPPSPPPEEILPPAPPPGESGGYEDEYLREDDEIVVGRRLNVLRGGGGGKSGGGATVRTRTRVVPPSSPKKEGYGGESSRERFRPRLRDKVKSPPPHDQEVYGNDPNVITDFVFSDIRCFKTSQREYFGATIHLKSGFHLPYIRDRPHDPLSSEECRLEQLEGARGSYHMSVTDLRGCGVEYCGDAMCLTMVFPRVPILALADDEVTTIKCIPQKSTISDTKSISFAGDSMEGRKSSSTVEGGVQEFVAEVGIFRQNPGGTNGLFVKKVNSGGVVQLGEPLQLRSVVRGSDGWNHAKLTDVKVWRMGDNLGYKNNLANLDPNQASEVITLVDHTGCRNEEYVVIADDHPIKDPRNDMMHHFTFKAFLFRGQRVNEPLIVTAKVHACQEAHDCEIVCESYKNHQVGRRRRSSPVPVPVPDDLSTNPGSLSDHKFRDSKVALRVVGFKDHPSSFLDDEFPFEFIDDTKNANSSGRSSDLGAINMTCNEKMFATGLGGGCVMLLICGLALALYTYFRQGKSTTTFQGGGDGGGGGCGRYRYRPPPGGGGSGGGGADFRARPPPYQKPLPPTPTATTATVTASNALSQKKQDGKIVTSTSDISQVAKLLRELAKKNSNQNQEKNGKSKCRSNNNKNTDASDYASIDETSGSSGSSSSSSPSSSAISSLEDLRKSFKNSKNGDGVYFVYCYNKDKDAKRSKRKPQSAPNSTRLLRKQIQTENDEADEDSQTDDDVSKNCDVNKNNQIVKNQAVRRTVREVKKKSKQNNNLNLNNIRHSGRGIRRKVSSVYREGYLNGIRNSLPLKYNKGKSPSTRKLPQAPPEVKFKLDQHETEAMTSSDLDSAYSGSNCSKVTEVEVDDREFLKRANNRNRATVSGARCPDVHNFHRLYENLADVRRQLQQKYQGGQGQSQSQKWPNDSVIINNNNDRDNDNDNNNLVARGVASPSPPLSLGETKATHFVTRDDASTKILIVPETHV